MLALLPRYSESSLYGSHLAMHDSAPLPITRQALTRLKAVDLKKMMKGIGLGSSGLRKQELIDTLIQYYGEVSGAVAHTESTTGGASSGSSSCPTRQEGGATPEARGGNHYWDEREVLEAMRKSLAEYRPLDAYCPLSIPMDVVELQDSSQGPSVSCNVEEPIPDVEEPAAKKVGGLWSARGGELGILIGIRPRPTSRYALYSSKPWG